jgi:triacylglycerol lipase
VSHAPTRHRPAPDITLVFHPARDTSYVHFLEAESHAFDAAATRLGRRNAWWLAEAALLSYWAPDEVRARYARVGFDAEPLFDGTTNGYLAWNAQAAIVSFRGTEPGEPGDVLDDLTFALAPWDRHGQHVHLGFKIALDRVWPVVAARLEALAPRPVWFTGHSLGAALATLAADRSPGAAGVCTLGAPRIGDWHFAAAHSGRFGPRALRYVNDADIVTHLPPPLPYQHTGTPRFIDPSGHVSETRPSLHHYFQALVGDAGHVREVRLALDRGHLHHAPDFLLDHMPLAYAVDIWNDYARYGD